MATNNAINLSAAGVVTYNGTGTFTGSSLTANALLYGGASNAISSLALTNGQLAIGSTGAAPSAATLTAGTGISITNGAGSITIAATGAGFTWNDITGTSASMAVENGYLADNAGLVTLTLPATAPQFSSISVAGHGAGGWKIAQNASQQIIFGSTATTAGTGGSLASTNANDALELLAVVGGSSTIWMVLNSVGNITVV